MTTGEVTRAFGRRPYRILVRDRARGPRRRRGWLVRRMLAAADALGLTLAFFLAVTIVGSESNPAVDRVPSHVEALLFLLTLPVWIVGAKVYGLYEKDEERTDHSTADDVVGVFHMVTVGSWGLFAGAWLTGWLDPQLPKLFAFWVFAVVLVPTLRAAARAYCRRHVAYLQNAIVVGTGEVGRAIARKLLNHPEYGIHLVGFVDDEPERSLAADWHAPLLGDTGRLHALVETLDVERVIVCLTGQGQAEAAELVRSLQEQDVQVDVVPCPHELVGPSVSVHTVEGLPLLGLARARLSRSSALLKRTFDLALTIPGLLVLSPVLAAIAVAIKLDSPGPVLFRQVRMGANGPFRMWKFRTMWVDADERKHEFSHLNKHLRPGGDPRMFKIEGDPRVTRVGRFLRHYSLDELPQLFNVLSGEMSLVGPRPLILDEDGAVAAWGRRRLNVKPGITGLWQVLGRDDIPFHEMVQLDYRYVTSWSLGTDLKLIARTVPVVARRREG